MAGLVTRRARQNLPLEALGQTAPEAGRRVTWSTSEALGVLVCRHRVDDSVTKGITRILRRPRRRRRDRSTARRT